MFAWQPSDIPGVPRKVIEHHLAVCPHARPVKQKVRKHAVERQEFIAEEIKKLEAAGLVRGVLHPTWLANPVVVRKANGKWRLCIDFTDVNKACPKDPFPLPRIDQIVDSTAGCDLLSFLDAYSGYHQIFMAEEDEEKTAFITPCGTYCFVRMPFGLKNAGSTFARVVHHAFEPQMHRNVEAYMDDIVVKSKNRATLIQDLDETFANLRKINLKLNPEKCVFGVPSGKLLGFFVSQRGIEANPDKIKAIEQIEAPKRVKDVRRLAGCVAALSRFISRSAERALPFFKILKKAGPMKWTPEAEAALQDLKRYLSSTPTLVAPKPQEKLLLYIAATNQVVSAALVAEREADDEPATTAGASSDKQGASPASSGPDKDGSAQMREEIQKKMVQRPVYFVSSLLQGARSRYSGVQKLLFGLLMASRKLRHYFQAHEITVVTRFPLKRILQNPEATGRIVEWALELSSFGLKFESTSTIQSRALAEFIAEWTPTPDEEIPETSIPVKEASKEWLMYFDGAFSLQDAGAGVLLVAPTGEHLKYVVQMHFPKEQATNNTAEYEGLLAGLRIAADLGIKKLIVRGDSQLVVRQVNKNYQSPLMEAYVDEVRKLEEHFDGLQMEHIPRAQNDIADGLSKCAALKLPVEPGIFVLKLTQPSVTPSTGQSKKRKLVSGDYFPIELPEAAAKKVPKINTKEAEGQFAPASLMVCSVEADAPDKFCSGKLAGEHQAPAGPQVLAVEADVPTAADVPLVLVVEPQAPAWAQQIVHFLQTGELPEEQEEAERVARQSSMYQFVDNTLYRRRLNGVKLKCIHREDGQKLLAEIHGGICGHHIGARALAGKAFRQGFFWPTALQDATAQVTKCEACQFHSKQIHQPAQALQTIPLSWPFSVWGLDILGPFPRAVGGFEYLYVAIDKFTKWPEVEPVRKVTAQSAVKFFRSIVCRFGIPNRIITDNGTQFTSRTFMQYVQDLGAKVCFASVAHPRSNGQAERANAEVLRGLKTRTFDRLHKCGRNWIEELPVVLWSIRTTPNRATGQTPFALVYGAEAVLPTELVYGSPRVLAYDELEQEQLRQDDALLLEEDRLQAAVRAARYQQALRRYHSRKVKARSFEEGDLVLRRVQSAKNSNKLTPKWEGPYRVKRVTRPGAVRLETEDGIPVSNSWNIEHLRKFYP